MTSIPKIRKVVNTQVTPYNGNNLEQVLLELQEKSKELGRAVNELQALQIGARTLDAGLPADKARCELLDGQFLRMIQSAVAPTVITVEHGLKRTPQGVIWILSANSNNQALITGEFATNTPPADKQSISFRLNGSIGNTHICIVF